MTYVIGEACIDVLDRACVEECPVDCIYEGDRTLYIHPDECVDCGACEPVCPVEAIFYEDDVPDRWPAFADENARFFAEPLPGRDEPVGSPGGAGKIGGIGADALWSPRYPHSGNPGQRGSEPDRRRPPGMC